MVNLFVCNSSNATIHYLGEHMWEGFSCVVNIKELFPHINYSNLTSDDFLVESTGIIKSIRTQINSTDPYVGIAEIYSARGFISNPEMITYSDVVIGENITAKLPTAKQAPAKLIKKYDKYTGVLTLSIPMIVCVSISGVSSIVLGTTNRMTVKEGVAINKCKIYVKEGIITKPY